MYRVVGEATRRGREDKVKATDYVLRAFAIAALVLAGWQTAVAQEQTEMEKAPKVYIDCDFCDLDYIRTEIPFVNYVRDRFEAQVHVLITLQRTGSGGIEYTLVFIGRKDYTGKNDTLKVVTKKTATSDERRKALVKTLKLGLVRYVAYSPVADKLKIGYAKEATTEKVKDKWNYWVFSISTNTYANGEKSRRSIYLYSSVSASRVTLDWKLRFRVWGSFNEDQFKFGSSEIVSKSGGDGFSSLVVKSLGEHWSAGVRSNYFSSTYQNTKHGFSLSPAIEYDIFPYSQSTHRMLLVNYALSAGKTWYYEETIFDKTKETLFAHQLSITLSLQQPWGSTETSLIGSQYFHDLSKNRLELNNELRIRLFGGLSFRIFGSVSRIHDQLSLPKKNASREEVLLRRRMLATTYSYFVSFGISYTFGSIYTNIVNPRFGSGRGAYVMYF